MPELRARRPAERGEKRKRVPEDSSSGDDYKGHALRHRRSVRYIDTSDGEHIEDEQDDVDQEVDELDEVLVERRSLKVKLHIPQSTQSGLQRSNGNSNGTISNRPIFDLGIGQDLSQHSITETQPVNGDDGTKSLKTEIFPSDEITRFSSESESNMNEAEPNDEEYRSADVEENDEDEEEVIRTRPNRTSRTSRDHARRSHTLHHHPSARKKPATNGDASESEEYQEASSVQESDLTLSEMEVADGHPVDHRDLRDFIAPDTDEDQPLRRTTRLRERLRNGQGVLHDEVRDLHEAARNSPPRRLRERAGRIDYTIPPPPPLPSPRRKANVFAPRLFPTAGPFGGSGAPSLFGNNTPGLGAAGGAYDSDSSDDERTRVGAAHALGLPSASTHMDLSGTPNNLGKITKKQNLADSDPLGVDMSVSFESVGGMESHIQQLKEMVSLPLLYPEIFQRFNVTPPRGVLFHGPPGTGKTLLARALAASCSTEGRKISFYMRKGADCLSKWVGEAERQLRLLFEEARNSQPSIIFFDEIDGLAPVRSSKQEQIHASIVSTLLALMDGMDGRGQVIVIGATNRPDSVDPALRRPGRFDREFYFPLPNAKGRKSIIDIHTKGWEPPLAEKFKLELAERTVGYGGADIRAVCTEAALHAIQRRYPQIYQSSEKLLIKPESIQVQARDFMASIKKMVPSSLRSMSAGSSPLPEHIKPLLHQPILILADRVKGMLRESKPVSALEEAMYEDTDQDGFAHEKIEQEFQKALTFRPRLLIHGPANNGQRYLAAALLNDLEGFHVQSFDMSALMGDSTRTPEAAVIQLFVEVKRHKPSIIYLPDLHVWFRTLSEHVRETFLSLVRSIPPTDPILLFCVADVSLTGISPEIRNLFGYYPLNMFELTLPDYSARYEFFRNLTFHISQPPNQFPQSGVRKKRVLETLPKAPPPPPKITTKADIKAQERKDRQLKNQLKVRLGPSMEFLKRNYRKFRKPPIDTEYLQFLFNAETDEHVEGSAPFTKTLDDMILVTETGQKFHNMDLEVMEERMWNGFYSTPRQFLKDLHLMLLDAKTTGERERVLKAQEMYTNIQVQFEDAQTAADQQMLLEYERLHEREVQRQKDAQARSSIGRVEHMPSPNLGGLVIVDKTGEGEADVEMRDDVELLQHEEGSALGDKRESDDAAGEVGDQPLQATGKMIDESSVPRVQSRKNLDQIVEVEPLIRAPAEASYLSNISTDADKAAIVVAEPVAATEPPHPPFELDQEALQKIHKDWAEHTEGLTLEQLEQIYSSCMERVWSLRSMWNRTEVMRDVSSHFEIVRRNLQELREGENELYLI